MKRKHSKFTKPAPFVIFLQPYSPLAQPIINSSFWLLRPENLEANLLLPFLSHSTFGPSGIPQVLSPIYPESNYFSPCSPLSPWTNTIILSYCSAFFNHCPSTPPSIYSQHGSQSQPLEIWHIRSSAQNFPGNFISNNGGLIWYRPSFPLETTKEPPKIFFSFALFNSGCYTRIP